MLLGSLLLARRRCRSLWRAWTGASLLAAWALLERWRCAALVAVRRSEKAPALERPTCIPLLSYLHVSVQGRLRIGSFHSTSSQATGDATSEDVFAGLGAVSRTSTFKSSTFPLLRRHSFSCSMSAWPLSRVFTISSHHIRHRLGRLD